MDAIEYFNTHPQFKETRRHSPNYLCLSCGMIVRASPHYIPGTAAPRHCDQDMTLLSHQQTVAATHLDPKERAEWMTSGGAVRKVGGKRQWRAK
jgi:hypothetical protein